MDTRKTSISPLATAKKKAADYLFPLGERAKRAVQAACAEIAGPFRDVTHMLRIMIFLRFAKDFSSILKLYGVESVSENGWKAAEKPSYLRGKWFLRSARQDIMLSCLRNSGLSYRGEACSRMLFRMALRGTRKKWSSVSWGDALLRSWIALFACLSRRCHSDHDH